MEIAFFKIQQRGDIFHYYKVFGGNGKTKDGYQEVINFLNDQPIMDPLNIITHLILLILKGNST